MDDSEIVLTENRGDAAFHLPKPTAELDAFEDIEVRSENNNLVRDYNFENEVDDNFEGQIDFEYNNAENEKYRNELLFHVQGLGSVREINGLPIYVKGSHCEDSLKDLIKICKRDDADNPVTRIELGKWHILQNDILSLLVTQSQDKQLSFYLMILLVQLTETPARTSPQFHEIIGIQQDYKIAFLSNEVNNSILLHLADCLNKEVEQRSKLHDQMIELIMTLYRNILRVPDLHRTNSISEEVKQNLQIMFYKVLHQEQAFEAFVYLAQDKNAEIMKTLNLVFLEIFYHIFSAFDPSWIMKTDDESKSLIQKIREREEQNRKAKMGELSSRHARFDCKIKITRKMDGSSKIVHNPFITNIDDFRHPGQLKQPKSRRSDKKHETIFDKNLDREIIISDLIRQDDFDSDVNLKQVIKNFTLDFLEHAFNSLMEVCYEEIYTDSARVEDSDRIHYFIVMGFCLEINRLRFAKDMKAKNKVADSDLNPILEFDMQCIGGALQITHFELLYSTLVREVTKEKKTSFNVRIFHAALYAFLQLLKTVKEMSLAPTLTIRRASQILTQNIFYHDITKILRIGFNYMNPVIHDRKFVQDFIELVGFFFDMLEEYSKGKVMTIQTDRRIKKKKLKAKKKKQAAKRKNQEAHEEGAEFNGEEGENGGNPEDEPYKEYAEGQPAEAVPEEEEEEDDEDDDEDEEQTEEFKERKFNLASEFAILVDYQVVTKMLHAISGKRLETNSESINSSIIKFVSRIVNLLKADWFFYQIDYLLIFQDILNSNLQKTLIANQQFVSVIRLILRNYFSLLNKNKLLSVESLFRFSDRFIKDAILSCYKEEETNDDGKGDGGDDGDEPKDYGLLGEADADYERINSEYKRTNLWNQYSDSLLIKYYGEYENMDKCEEHLCLLLHSFSVNDISPKDIRKRIRQLKLHKSKEKAEQLFRELYSNSEKVSLEESLKLVFINISDRSFTADDFKDYVISLLEKYLVYKRDISMDSESNSFDANDYAIVPIEMREFDILEWQFTEQVLTSFNFRGPKQGEIYWRIPGLIRINDAEILKEDFIRCFDEVKSNAAQLGELSVIDNRRVAEEDQDNEEDDVDSEIINTGLNNEEMDIEMSENVKTKEQEDDNGDNFDEEELIDMIPPAQPAQRTSEEEGSNHISGRIQEELQGIVIEEPESRIYENNVGEDVLVSLNENNQRIRLAELCTLEDTQLDSQVKETQLDSETKESPPDES